MALSRSRRAGEASGNQDEQSGITLPGKPGALRAGISRRTFLVRSSLAAGAAAAVSSMPGLGNLFVTAEQSSPEVPGTAAEATDEAVEAAPGLGEPLVAHVVNASTGEINLYQGTAQVVARSPALAQALARLAMTKG